MSTKYFQFSVPFSASCCEAQQPPRNNKILIKKVQKESISSFIKTKVPIDVNKMFKPGIKFTSAYVVVQF